MENEKGISMLFIVMIISFIAVMCLAGYLAISQHVNDYNSQLQNQNNPPASGQQNTQTPTDQTAGWNTVNNSDMGFEFKYPTDFGSKYASFQSVPMAVVTKDVSKVDANGCLIESTLTSKESQVTINNMQFCLGTGSDPGAGQLYNSYNYTTVKNGNYITLEYLVHTLNGCSPYIDTSDYQPCTDFMNNYNNIVVKTIENSVSTLQFTK